MNSLSGSTGGNPIQFILEELVRGAVAERLPWKAIASDLNLSKLFVGVVADSLSLRDESADQSVVALHRALLA